MTELLRGVMPVAPTVFHDDESLDLHGQARVVDFLIDCGVAAVCVLANFSEQFSLTDDERRAVMRASIDAAAGRVPVCVAASHFSARVTADRCREAEELGASMVMLMPPFVGATMQCDDGQILEYFRRSVGGAGLDVMIQDAPLSPTRLSPAVLAELVGTVPRIRYAKIEVARAADKIRTLSGLIRADELAVFDGEEGVTLIPDLDAGAVGTMCSAMAPDLLVPVVLDHLAGRRDDAAERWGRVLPLLQHENRQLGPAAAKIALAAGGVIGSERVRAPLSPGSEAARGELVGLLRASGARVLSWAS